jgi:hypothetical protein
LETASSWSASSDDGLVAVDWVHAYTDELERIQEPLGLSTFSGSERERRLIGYLRSASLKPDWRSNTLKLNCLQHECGSP